MTLRDICRLLLNRWRMGTIEVNRGDCSDIDVRFDKGDQVAGFEMLKRLDSYIREVDMFNALKEAKANSRPMGIQRCLYPVCIAASRDAAASSVEGILPWRCAKGKTGRFGPCTPRGNARVAANALCGVRSKS